jgi:hypothetical protein
VAAEQLARVAQQHLEQVPFGRGEPDVLGLARSWKDAARRIASRNGSLTDDPFGRQVDHQRAEPDPGQVLGGTGPPDRRPHPGQQFFDAERLGDVVIGAGVERFHLVHTVGPAGQHDDRSLGPAAQPLDHLHSAQVGQAQVQDHQVGRIAAGYLEGLGSGRCDVHLVIAHPQVDPQRPQYLRLVVDDKHPGHWLSTASPAGASAAWRSRRPGSYS